MSREKNSTLVNEHSWNREPVPLTWDQALLLLLLFFVSLAREGKNNARYIHLTSRQPLPRLHNLTSAWPVMLLANQHLPDGNQILAQKSLLKSKKCRLKLTLNGWRHFGQSEQRKSSSLFPIRSEKSPDCGFFACDLWKDCIMPSFRKQIKEIKGEGMIAGYSKFNSSTSHVNNCFPSCLTGFLIMLQCAFGFILPINTLTGVPENLLGQLSGFIWIHGRKRIIYSSNFFPSNETTFNTRHNGLQFKCMLLELHVRTTWVGKIKQAKNDILNRKYSKLLLN